MSKSIEHYIKDVIVSRALIEEAAKTLDRTANDTLIGRAMVDKLRSFLELGGERCAETIKHDYLITVKRHQQILNAVLTELDKSRAEVEALRSEILATKGREVVIAVHGRGYNYNEAVIQYNCGGGSTGNSGVRIILTQEQKEPELNIK